MYHECNILNENGKQKSLNGESIFPMDNTAQKPMPRTQWIILST